MRCFWVGCLVFLGLGAIAAPGSARAGEPFADGCPGKALEEGTVWKLNHNPAARRAIVPAGPTSMRICRYYGFGEFGKQTPKTQARAGQLQDQAVVAGRDLLESLILEFKELQPAPKGPISCPADEGAELYAVFFYRHAKPVILDVSLSGCQFVAGAVPRARWLSQSLHVKLVRLAEGRRGVDRSHAEVKEKSAVAYPPPHLSYAQARHGAKELIEFFCEESKLCSSWTTGPCTRKTAKAFRCRYSATLKSGEVCRGSLTVKSLGERLVEESPGVIDEDEGECFYLFAPPGFKEEEEEEAREEAQEAERGKRSSKATGQPGRRT